MKMLKKIGRECKALYRDEQGADLIEYILIIAAIGLPLLGVIIWFRNDINDWVTKLYKDVTEDGKEKLDPGS